MAISQQYSQEQTMLTLAAISYRGFELAQPGAHKQVRMFRAMSECLQQLGPVKDEWEIVWGPASFRPFVLSPMRQCTLLSAAIAHLRMRSRSVVRTRCVFSIGCCMISSSGNKGRRTMAIQPKSRAPKFRSVPPGAFIFSSIFDPRHRSKA
jgi:hypothetical protein